MGVSHFLEYMYYMAWYPDYFSTPNISLSLFSEQREETHLKATVLVIDIFVCFAFVSICVLSYVELSGGMEDITAISTDWENQYFLKFLYFPPYNCFLSLFPFRSVFPNPILRKDLKQLQFNFPSLKMAAQYFFYCLNKASSALSANSNIVIPCSTECTRRCFQLPRLLTYTLLFFTSVSFTLALLRFKSRYHVSSETFSKMRRVETHLT